MTFGLVPSGGRGKRGRGGGSGGARLGSTRYSGSSSGRGRGGQRGGGNAGKSGDVAASNRNLVAEKFANSGLSIDDMVMAQNRIFDAIKLRDQIDATLGFARYTEGPERLGWLVNMNETLVPDPEWPSGRSAMDFYFIQEDGEMFKATLVESPYFLIACKEKKLPDVEEYIRRQFEKTVETIRRMPKEDLDLPNHLLGHRKTYLKLSFRNGEDLKEVRRVIMPAIKRNSTLRNTEDTYAEFMTKMDEDEEIDGEQQHQGRQQTFKDGLEYITDIREFDVPYLARVAIDFDYRVGLWYSVKEENGLIGIQRKFDRVLPAEPVVFAFDIETSKAPLKFPDSNVDQIMMISYMIDRQGYLITNREIVSDDIVDFDYSPRPGEYDGPFIIFNEDDEKALLERFYEHIRQVKPGVFVTYNGDFFDWPFIEVRSKVHDMDMYEEIGFKRNSSGEYLSSFAAHIDCFYWVKRDSYLPVGSQGLKAVTKAKLGYDPKELDPELMTRFAAEQPQVLADYSVSDAVATYYLYMKYVHPFIFSLCNIIPLAPDDVLRKGSGTLCEMLLMVEAYKANVIMPNKHQEVKGKMFEGHMLESETYVGGHVEALESGVFRSDLPTHFRLQPSAFEKLLEDLDRALKFSIEVEEKKDLKSIVNYDEVRQAIADRLIDLRDTPNRRETPLIYHLDVAAMYPNIILTNRLQPPALIDEEVCASCDFNKPEADCQRRMKWSWRGEFYPADRSEYNMIRKQLEFEENFPGRDGEGPKRNWHQLGTNEQHSELQKRLSTYCRKVYRRVKDTKVVEKESIICQRENSFYVDTVRNFRDRRYEYKGKLKEWKKNLDTASKDGDLPKMDEAKKMIVLMDSLQLAHKCILNSFYGYVMRKGSRWYSMEMAGIVCLTGANIIRMARELVEQIGRPLELDTDGIWCILPGSFPENFTFKCDNGKSFTISYPCSMLNHLVHDRFTNDQYQVLVDPETHTYAKQSENSIFFEVDGPYRAMILPASKEEDKLLKKRYAVFNDDGSLAELKGFEVKRRGELKIIKIFQEEIFRMFLRGTTLEECYAEVATVANRWLDILFSKGRSTSDEELLDYISENRSMSKTLEEYGTQKSTSITTAKRLAEFLGDQMVKDKGLACKFIIAAKPLGAPVAERAIPVAIFSAEASVKKHFLRKWLKDNTLKSFDIRPILDWQYYLERLGSTIQKLVTIPAAMQKVMNPVPRIRHPDWLHKRVGGANDLKQNRITDTFAKANPDTLNPVFDMEDFGQTADSARAVTGPVVHRTTKRKQPQPDKLQLPDEMPDLYADYSEWLKYQKIKWKIQRRERKSAILNGEVTLARRSGPGLSSYFQQQNQAAARRQWEIIQIAETDFPGVFRMWVLIDKNMYSISLNVHRKFYVNCREPDTQGLFKRVNKVLPRSHTPLHLYEFVVSEKEYQENSDVYKTFAWHHDTVGVYETKVPLLFRSLFLGCTVVLDRSRKEVVQKSLDEAYSLEDFCPTPLPSGNYLDGNRLQFVFLYHSNTDDRHVFGFFVPHTGKVRVVVVDPFDNRELPNLSRDYTSKKPRCREVSPAENEVFPYSPELDCNVSFRTTEAAALRDLQRAINEYRNEKRGPAAIVIQTPRPLNVFTSRLGILKEFPCVAVPFRKVDNSYPALGWQTKAGRRMISNYLEIRDVILERIQLSRYANVPLANIENDAKSFLSDLFYSRSLSKHDVVLWYSPTERPDLGGREDDDNFLSVDDFVDTELNYAGSYNTICIEYTIHNLPVNTISQFTYINEVEGADGYAGLTNANMKTIEETFQQQLGNADPHEIIDPNAPSFIAFKALRDLVRGWSKEKFLYGNVLADYMIKNFYRWVSSPSSKLFDPSIYGYLHGLMKKVLMQLLAEFKRLGSKIVFANFNKIIIATTKTNLVNAQAYSQFILQTLKKKDIFNLIDLTPVCFWDQLLWMDSVNYGGIPAGADATRLLERWYKDAAEGAEEQDLGTQKSGGENDEDEDDESPVELHWNIQRFLPPFLQEYFVALIGEFLLKMYELKQRRRQGCLPGETPVRGIPRGMTASQVHDQDESVMDEKRLIREYFTRKLLDMIPLVQQTSREVVTTAEDLEYISFPELPGSHLKMDNPALELIKSVCKVLSLTKDLEHEVRILRRTLLNMIDVREFSSAADFVNPCESFILRHVICSFCQHCRDLDLSMDDREVSGGDGGGGVGSGWHCPACHTEYDNTVLEELLIEMLQRNFLSYQLQDLICEKCKEVKEGNVREHCKACASQFTFRAKGNKVAGSVVLKRKLKTLRNVAQMYRMPFLMETVDFYLQQTGALAGDGGDASVAAAVTADGR